MPFDIKKLGDRALLVQLRSASRDSARYKGNKPLAKYVNELKAEAEKRKLVQDEKIVNEAGHCAHPEPKEVVEPVAPTHVPDVPE
jgi:hypothetical protein